MIFKRDDVIDIAQDKKALQSSVSKYSCYMDASRACKKDISIEDYAFHTGLEENPWWMIDLENEEIFDIIRITNRTNKNYQKRLENLIIELSLDKKHWSSIDSSCFEWKNGLEVLEINLYGAMSARYVKITLKGNNYLHFKKIEIFKTKVKAYVVAARNDGLGERMNAILGAMYIANRFNFSFRFSWPTSMLDEDLNTQKNNPNISLPWEMLNKEELFSKSFLQNYLLDDTNITFMGDDLSACNTLEKINSLELRKWGLFVGYQKPYFFVPQIEQKECLKTMSVLYKNIDWGAKAKNILFDVEEKSKVFNNSFTAFHMRGGEVVLSDFRICISFAYSKHFPYEIALDIAEEELKKGKNIIIFGNDFESNRIFRDYLKKNNKTCLIETIDTFVNKDYSNAERSFFEVNFMAKASKIVATGGSGYSRFAESIAGKTILVPYYTLYTRHRQYEIMLKNIDCLSLTPLQKAFSYNRIYNFTKILNMPLEKSLEYLNKALSYDPENEGYRVEIIDCYFKMKKLTEIEKILDSIIKTQRLNKFENALYGSYTRHRGMKDHYNEIYKKYLDFKDSKKYPNIALIASKLQSNNINVNIHIPKTFFAYQENLKYSSVARVRNHLAYRLGSAIILCSRSFWGIISMPFVLSFIKLKYKQEKLAYQNLIRQKPEFKLPNIETYTDYAQAIKEKNSITYKLGEAMIDASRSWLTGGFLKFYFQTKKLEKEFRKDKG